MGKVETLYPKFDVMEQKEHWDPHTLQIVEDRIKFHQYDSLSQKEAETLFQICSLLLDDTRDSVLHYVLIHFDKKLSSDIGEAQRKKDVPKESILIREGLRALDRLCTVRYGSLFAGLEDQAQREVIEQMMLGLIELQADGVRIPVQDFFAKLLSESVSAYYSYPAIWSEIGYAGPAYPRGYVRTERGLTDPWEAKRTDEQQ